MGFPNCTYFKLYKNNIFKYIVNKVDSILIKISITINIHFILKKLTLNSTFIFAINVFLKQY